jgi:tRNA pseudouridine55 synthase
VEVKREPRRVQIHRFTILDFVSPRIDFEIECSKGTYVRTLAEDLAASLGTIATVEWLTRAAIGTFSIDDSVRLISRPGSTREGLRGAGVSMSAALAHLPAVLASGRAAERIRRGEVPPLREFDLGETEPVCEAPFRVVGVDDALLAIGRTELLAGPSDRNEVSSVLRLDRVF